MNEQANPTDPPHKQAEIRVRCPDCMKLYQIDPAHITVPQPEFKCQSCATHFWISFPEVLDIPVAIGIQCEPKAVSSDFLNPVIQDPLAEPKASAAVSPQSQSPNIKAETQPEQERITAPPACTTEKKQNPLLENKWKHVINDYKSVNQHMLFVELCRKNKNFDFGVEKYQRLLEINPHDEIAGKHLALLEARLKSDFHTEKKAQPGLSQKFLEFFPSALLILGVGFVGLGFSEESLSQFMGVGAALICCYMIYKVISFPD